MAEKIFCGSVIEKFDGDILDVRLEAAVLRQGVYTGQGMDGNPCQYVNVSVRKSRQGNWYVELDMYRKENPAQQQSAPPQQPAAPPPPFPAQPAPAPRPPATVAECDANAKALFGKQAADQSPYPIDAACENDESIDDIPF